MDYVINNELRKYANRHFVIRISPTRPQNITTSIIVGAGMLFKHIGQKMACKLITGVYKTTIYKPTYKLRRGITIEFNPK